MKWPLPTVAITIDRVGHWHHPILAPDAGHPGRLPSGLPRVQVLFSRQENQVADAFREGLDTFGENDLRTINTTAAARLSAAQLGRE